MVAVYSACSGSTKDSPVHFLKLLQSKPGLVVEFELLPELTANPKWGAGVTRILKSTLLQFEEKKGIKTASRVIPNDIREFEQPPLMRKGRR